MTTFSCEGGWWWIWLFCFSLTQTWVSLTTSLPRSSPFCPSRFQSAPSTRSLRQLTQRPIELWWRSLMMWLSSWPAGLTPSTSTWASTATPGTTRETTSSAVWQLSRRPLPPPPPLWWAHRQRFLLLQQLSFWEGSFGSGTMRGGMARPWRHYHRLQLRQKTS